MNVADILEKAADLIEPEGAWTQGAYSSDDLDCTCRCLVGAIASALDTDEFGAEKWIVRNRIATRFFGREREGWLISWNDSPERTQAEVVAKLREAAAEARLAEGRG
jgi:hypothetical protein